MFLLNLKTVPGKYSNIHCFLFGYNWSFTLPKTVSKAHATPKVYNYPSEKIVLLSYNVLLSIVIKINVKD